MASKKTTKTTKKGASKAGKVAAVGVGVAALSVAAYLLFGPEGKKNRKKVRGWMVKMKGEIIEKCEKVKDVTEPVFDKIVDTVSSKYQKMAHVDDKELEASVKEIKKHWKSLVKDEKSKSKPKKSSSKKSKK